MAGEPHDNPHPKEQFPPTRWSLIERVRSDDDADRKNALAEVCRIYWYPIYGFIRRWGRGREDAEDLTQEFLVRQMERGTFNEVAAEHGKLRTFLLILLKRFLSDDLDRRRAVKRGGRETFVPIDDEWAEAQLRGTAALGQSPEAQFDRSWAICLLDGVTRELRAEYEASGKSLLFDAIKGALTSTTEHRPYAQIAESLGMSENGIKIAVYRLRQRYRQLLHERILQTVDSPGEVEGEIRFLCELFSHD